MKLLLSVTEKYRGFSPQGDFIPLDVHSSADGSWELYLSDRVLSVCLFTCLSVHSSHLKNSQTIFWKIHLISPTLAEKIFKKSCRCEKKINILATQKLEEFRAFWINEVYFYFLFLQFWTKVGKTALVQRHLLLKSLFAKFIKNYLLSVQIFWWFSELLNN